MWKHDDPEGDPRWLNVYFIVFGTLNAVAILLNFGLMIAKFFR